MTIALELECCRKHLRAHPIKGRCIFSGNRPILHILSEDVNKLREEISEKNKELQTLVNSLATENISLRN